MKKIVFVLLVLMALAVSVVPALASPIAQLNDLARYYPADTAIFAAVRVDDAFFQTIDGLVARVAAALPEGTIPPFSVSEALDEALGEANPPMSFQQDIRPWLGDTAAFGVLNITIQDGSTTRFLRRPRLNSDAPVLVAVAIKDRNAVNNLFERLLAQSNTANVQRTDADGYTIYENPDDDQAVVIVRDDVLLLTNQRDRISRSGVPDGSLSGSADFNDTFALLPEDDYNASAYINLPTFVKAALAGDPDAAAQMGLFGNLFDAIGPQAWGMTILDNTSLTLDVAQRITDPGALTELGLSMSPPAPIDPAFAARIPASAPLVIQGTDLNRSLGNVMAMLQRQIALLDQANLPGSDNMQQAENDLEEFTKAFTTFTGLDLNKDVLSWMTGNYALFVMLNPDLNLKSQYGFLANVPVDFGLAIEVTDADAAAKTVEGLTEGINRLAALAAENDDSDAEVTISSETMVGTDVTVVTISGAQMPWPLELLLAANGDVFAFGTRSAVHTILSRDGGLAANPAYTRAQDFMLKDSASLLYLGTEGLLPLTDLIITYADESDETVQQQAETARNLLQLVSSVTLSQTQDASGNSLSRLSINLSE